MVSTHQPGQAEFKAILPEDMDWKPFPAFPPSARLAVVVGQPTESGPYVIRVKVPYGVKLMPHRHPEDRIYTVMSGVFYIGLGERFDGDKVHAYPPGSVIVLPGDTSHFHWAKSGEYVTQVTANGPFALEYVDSQDDPRVTSTKNVAKSPIHDRESGKSGGVTFVGGIMKSERKGINTSSKPSGTGCVECMATGGWWFHLRRCAECGHIGCCDSSPNQHASKHAAASGHPIITSFEPGERWFYDYRTGETLAGPRLAGPQSHPLDQPVPGPAGRVPSDWQKLLHE